MILAGGLGIFFGFGLVDYFKSRISRGGPLIFTFGMLLLVLVGWFESGTDPHVTVSLLFFAVTTVGVLVVGIGETEQGEKLGFIILIIILLGAVSAFLASRACSGAAIPEIIGAVVFGIFALIYSYKIWSTAE
ncbi:hypothetical protein AKJ65_01450 [candidate division MSBL1 archaeon SCGC-AAA259E19]|uniref:Uncharacterized protein n=1 Tax=candidate division MSBL1 archaeon SCGC-AAA259E19 TaxID=1698264 RepID=A0A133UNA0_9EURY|nr:hypothetical protein AKJ65_01450 [candidate division MSBL1 archaeon SCGC-AAA259E19]